MTDAPAPRRSWLKLAFGASLAVNLFLVGLVGGQVFSSEPDERPNRPRGYSLHPRVMMQALPEERHEAIRAFYAEARKGMGRSWRGIGEIRGEIDAALRAQPFDPDVLRAAQRREVEARAALRNEQNDDISALLASLTDEDRTMIADLALERQQAQREYWRDRRRQREARENRAPE